MVLPLALRRPRGGAVVVPGAGRRARGRQAARLAVVVVAVVDVVAIFLVIIFPWASVVRLEVSVGALPFLLRPGRGWR